MGRRSTALIVDGRGINIFGWVPPRFNQNGKLELHVPFANYEGPRTDVKRRLQEGLQGTTNTDQAAKQHDITYYNVGVKLRRGEISRKQAEDLIRKADSKLMNKANGNLSSYNPLEKLHALAATSGMIAKTAAEDLNVMDPLKFVDAERKKGEKTAEEELHGGKAKPKPRDLVKGLRNRVKSLKI
jgi:hypothetical protein